MSNQLPFYLWKRLEGERENDRFGDRIACGDINGDGKDEWVISASNATLIDGEGGFNPLSLHYMGRIYVFSSDLELLFTINGEYPGDYFGASLVLGDVNGDGVKEILVGAPLASNEQWLQCGQISIFSGITGKQINRWYGNEDYARLGSVMTVLDWEGDGVVAVAAASHLSHPDGIELDGRVTIYSGSEYQIIQSFQGTGHEGLGLTLSAGDVNGDGKDEIIMGAPRSSNKGMIRNGRVVVYSKELGMIHESMGNRSYDEYGYFVSAGDLDGDGKEEILIGSPKAGLGLTGDGLDEIRNGLPKMGLKNCGTVTVLSVEENRLIMEKKGWFGYQGLGTIVLPLVEQADGISKVLVGANKGITFILDMNGNVVYEFDGYLPEAFSHSLAVGHGNEGACIAIGAITSFNERAFMAGSVYFMSPTSLHDKKGIEAKISSLTAEKEYLPAKSLEKMKILLSTYWYLPHVGGVDVYVRTLKEELEKRGHQVDVLAHHPDMAHYYLVGGDKKVEKWPIKRVIYDKVFQFFQRYLPHVEPWIRWRDIERYCFEVAAAQFDLGQYDVIHTQDIISTRALSRVKPADTPLVASIHGLLAKEHLISGQIVSRDSLAWKYVVDEEYYGCTSADVTILPTNWLRKEMEKEVGVSPEQLVIIPYGINIEEFERRAGEPLASPIERKGTFTICCPARLVLLKGHRILLGALHRLKSIDSSWHCWLVGDGLLRTELERCIASYGLNERVTMLGDRQDVPALLKESDLMVLPSLHDNLPYSIMEAQIAGTPIIASDTGGIPEMIRHEQTGLLFEVGNEEQLARQIYRMMVDPLLREKLARTAADWARNEWSVRTLLQRTLEIYEYAQVKVRE